MEFYEIAVIFAIFLAPIYYQLRCVDKRVRNLEKSINCRGNK